MPLAPHSERLLCCNASTMRNLSTQPITCTPGLNGDTWAQHHQELVHDRRRGRLDHLLLLLPRLLPTSAAWPAAPPAS